MTLDLAVAAFGALTPLSIAGMNIAAGAVTVAALWKADWKAARRPVMAVLGAYVAVAGIAALAGIDPAASLPKVAKEAHKLWIAAAFLIAMRRASPKFGAAGLALGFAAAAAVGLWQSLTQASPDGLETLRAHGFTHPVTFGIQMGLAVLGAACFLAASAHDRRVLAGLLALTATALVFSRARGALLGVFAGLTALVAATGQLRRKAWLLGLAAVAGIAGVELLSSDYRSVSTALRALFDPSAPDTQWERMKLWRVGWRIFLDHPWLGAGPGHYGTLFDRYFQGSIEGQAVWGSAHNLYLQQLAERGLAGAAALLSLFGYLAARAWARCRESASALNLWALAAAAAFPVMNLTEAAFQSEATATLFLFIWCWAEARHGAGPAEKVA